ncbi:hypothetical protein QBL02_11040 [Leucobacter sp. UT-8R-CII-1-4]|uniref:lipopolysaccharide biosynthesis protein n=1 Tax=Leucobacter sp. UT-8R-CII-1-4 TaxID=3040075 RepID=UPI0024A940AC|nr:hypothetical protein [Leucobacter sp. UT-8R-CII-1-4]MDI6024080.1 hypothetical protein [Leucobacter sp. UT-8R-CII-1-4]
MSRSFPRILGRSGTGDSRRVASDSIFLVGGSAGTAVLGLVFWIAATTLYPVADVGRATTAVNTGTVLASIANLSMGPLLERFLPASGRLRGRAVAFALTGSAIFALLLGGGYAWWMPGTALFASAWERVGFALAVVVLAAFALLDSVLIGMHRARWVALKNVGHAVAKLGAIVLLAGVGGGMSLVGSWIVTAVAAVGVVEAGLWLTRSRWNGRNTDPALPRRRELAQFGVVSLGWMLAQALPGIAIPTIVITAAGVDDAAYYNIAWTIVAASLMMTSLVTGPFVAAASKPGANVGALVRSFALVLCGVSVVRGIGVGVVGPIALHLYGSEYAEHGSELLILMGIAHAVSGVAMLYGALARVARRIAYPMIVQLVASLVVVALVALWIKQLGIVAVGWAFLTHDILILIAAIPPLWILLRRLRTDGAL